MDNDDQSNDSESDEVAEESDSSEDEVHYLAFFLPCWENNFSLAAHSLNHCYFIRWYLEIQSEMFP